jgi:hypothetical protein
MRSCSSSCWLLGLSRWQGCCRRGGMRGLCHLMCQACPQTSETCRCVALIAV